jgi:IS5 family transposase
MKMDAHQYFSHQTLQENISKIDSETLAQIHVAIVEFAVYTGVDNGQKLRTDSTTIKTNIHHPTNAALLWDCIRVSCRLLSETKALLSNISYRNYQTVGKKLLFKIVNTHTAEKRRPLFKKMLQIQRRCERQVELAINSLASHSFKDKQQETQRQQLQQALSELLPKMKQVAAVTHRREIFEQHVPVDEKLFSIFEDHTDCIVKGGREVVFGHKINFTTGKSNLIFDCIQERGNPADVSYYEKTLDNIHVNFEITPRDMAADGGFASKANHAAAKARGIVNIVFNKVKGSLQNTASSHKMETMLKKWRAGMEAVISNFKRGLNASMIPWKGWEAFKCFVLWSLITFNLRVIAKYIIDKLA